MTNLFEAAGGSGIAERLLRWFEDNGRRDLPWQQDRGPYRVWVSEVMLQQTQVATVIPYYNPFMSSYPTVEALAAADLDAVLHLWTGLGYYARARNLHRAAGVVVERYGGCVPEDIDTLQSLPGIGRSTAGAILALASGQRHSILDGNARRVLARHFGVEGHIGQAEVLRRLWELADTCTPAADVADYTQAIMDLGSTVCTRIRPGCDACPLADTCAAFATGRQHAIPSPRPTRIRPRRSAVALLVVRANGAVLLEQRPPDGLWGGLASPPMFESEEAALSWCHERRGATVSTERLPAYEHAFTHFDLTLRPLVVRVEGAGAIEGHLWYDAKRPPRVGLSKPAVDLVRAAAETAKPRQAIESPKPGSR